MREGTEIRYNYETIVLAPLTTKRYKTLINMGSMEISISHSLVSRKPQRQAPH